MDLRLRNKKIPAAKNNRFLMNPISIKREMDANDSIRYWESNLVCPSCKGDIGTIEPSIIQCKKCHSTFPIIHGVPCFVANKLSEHQKSELGYVLSRKGEIQSRQHFYNQVERCYKWAINWINDRTINQDTKIICIGGSYVDDLPHIRSNFKFNIDHLAHKYIQIFPQIARANIKHIAGVSEALPFKDNYADIIYSRNSLDHVSNPIKTLIEVNRVLKPEGRFFLFVYYNSTFIDSAETTVIDDEFVNVHLKNLFDVEWMEVRPSESEGVPQPPMFSLPNKGKLGFLYAVCKKKYKFQPYDSEVLREYERLISNFHSAIYYDQRGEYRKASRFFKSVINSKPFLKSDEMRILYSRIRYLSINNRGALKDLFKEFKLTNRDPFWWKIMIDSSYPLMRDMLKKEIGSCFFGDAQNYLRRCLRNSFHTFIKRKFYALIRRNDLLYRFIMSFYNKLQKS